MSSENHSPEQIPSQYRADIDALPPRLRRLLDNELAVGNAIAEIGHSHPAPPIGAYIKLARPVTSQPRESGDGLTFYERNSSLWHGEFTDADRRYWILEPPSETAGVYPDMEAIRAALQPQEPDLPATTPLSSAWTRFEASTELNYERWKEGMGYDLDALAELSPLEQRALESRFTPPRGWRDVEALAVLGTPTAQAALKRAVWADEIEVRLAVLSHAPELIDEQTQTQVLLRALTEAAAFAGRTETLDLVMDFHPPVIVEALWAGLLSATGEMAYHFAATLTAIKGLVDSRYDWSLRPLYLAFSTEDREARRAAFLVLCKTLGVDGETQLAETEQRLRAGG